MTNCPITSLVIALELFGYEGMEYFSIIIAVAFALSGYYGLYAARSLFIPKQGQNLSIADPTDRIGTA